jgi:lactoylglutathione lyase
MLKGLHHIGVMVTDIDKSIDFYKSIGMELTHSYALDNGTKLAFIRAGSAVIELVMGTDPASVKARGNGIVDHIALEVENIQCVVDDLKAKGIVFDTDGISKMGLFANGCANIFLKGPDGERLELFEEL